MKESTMIVYLQKEAQYKTVVSFDSKEGAKDQLVNKENGERFMRIAVSRRGSMRDLQLLPRKIISLAQKEKCFSLSIDCATLPKHILSQKEWGEVFAVNAELANYAFTTYKTPPKEGWPKVESIHFSGKLPKAFWEGLERGRVIGEEVNRTRELANTPGGDMTPEGLAHAAQEAMKDTKATVNILDEGAMKKLGMGAILGVGKGSDVPPRFIVIEWKGKAEKKPLVFVGKGVTFDTGGLNLKPGNSINDMHMDMSGGAAVIHALAAIARLGIKKHVIGLIPAVENMPSGSSYRPGDVLRSMSGKTIEIGNTDAEGRVILADALTYAEKYSPRFVVDVATLTGAACVALGDKCSALFTKTDGIALKLTQLGEATGDRLWRLPLWDEYEEGIKGSVGDWSNVGKGRDGGAINGAIFLYQFAKSYPWAHIDIAPRMTTVEGEYLAKGAAGEPVRLLVRIAEKM